MKGKAIFMAAVMHFVLSDLASAIPPDELPFGAMYLEPADYEDTSEVRRLAEDMCFNYFVEYRNVLNSTNIGRLYDYGIQSIRGGIYPSLADAEDPMKYSWSNYAMIEVDFPYPNEEVRMESFGDSAYFDPTAHMWVSKKGSPGDTLSGFSTYLLKYDGDNYRYNHVAIFNKYYFNFPGVGLIHYRIDVCMKIDAIGDTSDIVAYLDVEYGKWKTCEMHVEHVDTIRARDFMAADSLHWIESNEFTVPESIMVVDKNSLGECNIDTTYYFPADSAKVVYLSISIATTGNRRVSVDEIVISDEEGRILMADDRDSVIVAQFQQYAPQDTAKIFGWMLMDEPFYTNLLPFRRIDSLMHTVYSGWVTFTDNRFYAPAETISRSYLDIVGVDFLNPDIYPYGPGNPYAGNSFQDYTEYPGGPLHRFNNHVSWVREAVDERNKDFWLTVQAFSGTWWRFPTGPELSCNVYMALCWGCQGIQFWYYDTHHFSGWCGIRDASQDTTRLYNQIKEHIGPYIQAFDEYYMPLSWDTAYTYHSGTPAYDPPPDAYVDSISAWVHPDSTDDNPDAGWFHVGEFHDDTAKYIMLVNRACSQGENDPDPAPSVTATVKFDPNNLGLGNYVYIIDLADSLRLAGADTGWVGIPDTTYSARMPDGTIPFTTVLGPGEGRLFKIVETSRIALKDTLAEPGFSYQGSIKINGDVIIPSGSTFKVKGPANFRIAQCDSSAHGGLDNTLVEIVCDGRMSFIGTENDSIYFRELYDCASGLPLEIIDPGDWYGIRDKSDDYDTLSYCFIRFAYNGYSGEATSNAIIRHCRISNSENSGIRLVNACRDTLNVDSCLISDNGSHGIEATISCLIADGNTITKNTSSGVYIVENGTIPCGDLDYRLANNTITQGDDYSTQKGVNVIGTTTDHPAVVFEGNQVWNFNTAGVYLCRVANGDWSGSGSGTRFTGYNDIDSNGTYGLWCYNSSPAIYSTDGCDGYNSFSRNDNYGIYCTNSSSPQIKQATLALNRLSNFYNLDTCNPCLGDTSAGGFDGENVFVTADRGYDFKTTPLAQNIILAQNNYWGEWDPDVSDFYPDTSHIRYIPYLNENPCGDPMGKVAGVEQVIPEKFALYQNYPNPFNPATSISFDLPRGSQVRISIYNILGQRVQILTDEYCEPGHHVVVWDSRDRYGNEVASGIYFYLLEASQFADVRKMLILR